MARQAESETWRSLVLNAMPPPAWLSADAPHGDVVLSSRARAMRNLRGFRFPHRASADELRLVEAMIVKAARPSLEPLKNLTAAERDYLVGCRLVSPDFHFKETGRAVLLDHFRFCSAMTNEEDHLRLQILSAGWSIERTSKRLTKKLEELGLDYAWSPRYGYLAASPYNAGEGRRLSAMFHLIGLAHLKRLPGVLKAISARGLAARGLFGESSRAVGAFVQVSITNPAIADIVGAGEYLIAAEREARKKTGRLELAEKAKNAFEFAAVSTHLTLADALRILGWARWAASEQVSSIEFGPRDVDAWLTALEIRSSADEDKASRQRGDFVRARLEL